MKVIINKMELELSETPSIVFDYENKKWEDIHLKTKKLSVKDLINLYSVNEISILNENGQIFKIIPNSISTGVSTLTICPKYCEVI